jgi:predicted ATPase/class 3 adenylate cyclase
MTICQNCQFDNPPMMRFCGNCGTRLESTVPEAAVAQRVMPVPVEKTAQFDPEQLGVMMGADLMERFRLAGLEAKGQRRHVTILFVDLSGFTSLSEKMDSEELYSLIEQYIRILVNDVYKYEGTVDKLTGDGLMALFGAPIAHENNAERALRAAIEMREDVFRLSESDANLSGADLNVHIGLNSGPVIVGGVGSNMLMNYTAIGDSVNMSKRLEENAGPGMILVSENVYRQTKELFEYQALSPLSLKGISQPVPAYTLMGSKSKPGVVRGLEGLHAPMIGRENEMVQLSQMVARLAADRQGGLALVMGEAGLGKTRLVRELRSGLAPNALKVLEGHSLTYRKSIAYWIFQDVVRSLLNIASDVPETVLRQALHDKVQEVLSNGVEYTLPYLEHLMSLKLSDPQAEERLSYLTPEQLRQQTFLAFRDLLRAEANRVPLLVVLEDFHWADETSIDLFFFMFDVLRKAPIMIIAVSRSFESEVPALIQTRARQRLGENFRCVQLEPLPPEQSKQLFYSLLAIPNLPDELREQIIQRSSGSPFYLEEILRMLIETNVIYRDGEFWKLTPGADASTIGVPDTLQGLILARFDRLNLPQKRLLQTAAVIGYQFNLQVLKLVMPGGNERDLQSVLKLLVEREFIVPRSNPMENGYVFKNVIVSDTIYGTLLQRDRRELHARVADAIEEHYAGRLDSQVELLASHFLRGARLERALYYLILAGQKAARGYANEQARQQFEQALSLMTKIDYSTQQALQIHIGLGDVLVIIGEYQAGRDHYQVALETISDEDQQQFAAESVSLQRMIATTFERQGDYEKSLSRLHRASQILSMYHLDLPVEQARIFNDMGWIYFRRGKTDQAETCLNQALELGRVTNQIDVIASIYNRLGGVFFQKEKFEQAVEYVHLSLELREKIGDIAAVARSYNNLGLLDWKRGNWDTALENFDQALRLQLNLGDVEGMIELNTNIGMLQLDRGNIDEARRCLSEALSTAQQIGHTYLVGLLSMNISNLYVFVENWPVALDYARRSLSSFKEIGTTDHLVELYAYTGLAWLGLGALDEAYKWGQDAINLFEQLGKRESTGQAEGQGRALFLLGEIARRRNQFDDAERLLEQSENVFVKLDNKIEQARVQVALSHLAVAHNDALRAGVLLDEARQTFMKLGAKEDLKRLDGSLH